MPIDIGLLRSEEEGGCLDQVRQWQILRNGGANNMAEDVDQLLTSIQALNVKRERLLRELDEKRKLLRILQQTIGSNHNNKNVVIVKEMKELKRHDIPYLEQCVEQASRKRDWKLSQVANCVIAPLLDIMECPTTCSEWTNSRLKRSNEIVVVDPLYCLRGYETLLPKQRRCIVWTGTGAALARSLSNHTMQFCRKHSIFSSFTPLLLPSCIDLETFQACSITGRLLLLEQDDNDLNDNYEEESTTTTTLGAVPPWVAALVLHEDKTYFDRQLPVGHVILTTTVRNGECSLLLDERETKRLESFGKKYKQMAKGERIELFCLTGNTVSEANTMQREMVDAIVTFHQSLLVMREKVEIQLRVVEASQLLPCEASRVVIESMLGKEFITLGYVSNMTDYSTRATKTKIGKVGSCFSVHGVLCSIPETVEWMLHHNVMEHDNELGVAVPPAFSLQVQEQLGMTPAEGGVLFLPFSRRIYHGKNGKVTRAELGNAPEPCVIQTSKLSGEQCHTEGNKRLLRKPFVREGPLTAQDVRDERLTCPFDFLPIGR